MESFEKGGFEKWRENGVEMPELGTPEVVPEVDRGHVPPDMIGTDLDKFLNEQKKIDDKKRHGEQV